MNCIRCNAPLAPNARFCRICGLPVPTDASSNAAPTYQSTPPPNAPTMPVAPWQAPQPQSPQYLQSAPPPEGMYYQPTAPVVPGSMYSGAPPVPQTVTPPRRRRSGCLIRSLLVLVILLLVVVGAWFLGVRPYLHGLVQSQVDQVLTNSTNQVNPLLVARIPAGTRIAVSETEINDILTMEHTPSDPLQNVQMHVTPGGLRLDFQAYGFPCAVTGVLQALQGQLVMHNVTVEGIISLVMSSEEMGAELNQQLANVQQRLQRPIRQVQLQNQQLTLTLG
jgi:hypothetical protein